MIVLLGSFVFSAHAENESGTDLEKADVIAACIAEYEEKANSPVFHSDHFEHCERSKSYDLDECKIKFNPKVCGTGNIACASNTKKKLAQCQNDAEIRFSSCVLPMHEFSDSSDLIHFCASQVSKLKKTAEKACDLKFNPKIFGTGNVSCAKNKKT